MPRFLLVDVGCIECGNATTTVEKIINTDDPPVGYRLVPVGTSARLDYEESRIAILLPEESTP